jgi:hypothetical protein
MNQKEFDAMVKTGKKKIDNTDYELQPLENGKFRIAPISEGEAFAVEYGQLIKAGGKQMMVTRISRIKDRHFEVREPVWTDEGAYK